MLCYNEVQKEERSVDFAYPQDHVVSALIGPLSLL